MITPTVGRVVWFYPDVGMDQPHAAIITYVWSDTCVNLVAFNAGGSSFGITSVPLIQDDNPRPDSFYAEWMPYQKGQTAKTEQLEAGVANKPDIEAMLLKDIEDASINVEERSIAVGNYECYVRALVNKREFNL